MNKEKACPIKFNVDHDLKCQSTCAWFNERHKECAIVVIGQAQAMLVHMLQSKKQD